MNSKLNRMMKDERGITALETAIILIAFVVVAAIFAFTVLSTGTFLTERSKEAAYAGLKEVRGSMELKGSLILTSQAEYVVFTLAPVSGGMAVDVSQVKMLYRDSRTNLNLPYSASATRPTTTTEFIVTQTDGTTALKILNTGQLALFTVRPGVAGTITHDQTFALEVKPPTGGILLLERTTPAQIDTVTDLH